MKKIFENNEQGHPEATDDYVNQYEETFTELSQDPNITIVLGHSSFPDTFLDIVRLDLERGTERPDSEYELLLHQEENERYYQEVAKDHNLMYPTWSPSEVTEPNAIQYEEWSIEKNMAFVDAAVDVGAQFLMASPEVRTHLGLGEDEAKLNEYGLIEIKETATYVEQAKLEHQVELGNYFSREISVDGVTMTLYQPFERQEQEYAELEAAEQAERGVKEKIELERVEKEKLERERAEKEERFEREQMAQQERMREEQELEIMAPGDYEGGDAN